MNKYSKQIRMMAAADCIIFSLDRTKLKKLFIKRRLIPEKDI